MKRLLFLALVLTAASGFAQGWSVDLGTNGESIVLCAPRTDYPAGPIWATNEAVTAGTVRLTSDNGQYVAMAAGTTGTTEPTIGSGWEYDGGVAWMRCQRGARNGYCVTLTSTNGSVTVSKHAPSSNGAGIVLYFQGSATGLDNDGYQGTVWGKASTNVTVGVEEW